LGEIHGCSQNQTCLQELGSKIKKVVSDRNSLYFELNEFEAVTLDESSVISWNQKNSNRSLTFVYLTNGMYALDNPICVMENSSEFTRKMTQRLQEYLLEEEQQKWLMEMGVRPINSNIIVPNSPFGIENGVNSDLLVSIEPNVDINDDLLMNLWYSINKL
jgi:hypothetical protein